MRFAIFGGVAALAVAITAIAWASNGPAAMARPSGAASASSELITLTTPLGDKRQQLVVIDPRQQAMSVYHIDLGTGEITLKAVRNIHWDLQLSEFNGTSPSPREIRAMLEQYR